MDTEQFSFSIPLAPPGASFTEEELRRRIAEARAIVFSLIPYARHLSQTVLEERTSLDPSGLRLSFSVVESAQLQLDLRHRSQASGLRNSILARLYEDFRQLHESATESHVRIGKLSLLAASMSTSAREDLLTDGSDEGIEVLALWRLMHKMGGKSYGIRFPDDEIVYTFPLFWDYVPEEGSRRLTVRVKNMSRKTAKVSLVREICAPDSAEAKTPIAAKELILHKTHGQDYAWLLLFSAMQRKMSILVKVTIVLRNVSLEPAYAELSELLDDGELISVLGEMQGDTDQASDDVSKASRANSSS
jgi:hypothetical protein